MRHSPFGEWVNVFYDPSKTDEDTLLQLIKDRHCNNAKQITDRRGHALNPIIAAGDPVQFQIESTTPVEMTAESKLPQGWKFEGQTSEDEGTQIVTLSTPKNTQQGNVDVELLFSDGSSIETKIAVVRQVGSH